MSTLELFLVGLYGMGIALCSLFSASLTGMTNIFLDTLGTVHPRTAKRLKRLKSNHLEGMSSLFIYDVTFVVLGAMTAISWSQESNGTWTSLFLSTALYLTIMVLIKTMFYSIGLRYAERLAVAAGRVIGFTAISTKPLNIILTLIKSKIIPPPDEESSREEFDALVDEARDEGTLDDDEYRLLKNIMNISEVMTSDVMTPRTVVFGCDAATTVEKAAAMPELQMFSRFPLWENNDSDNIIGYAITRDVLKSALEGKLSMQLHELVREVYFIPENAPLAKALEQFLKRRQHLFVVVDEYGGVEGLITMEDVMEAILGTEIVDENDRIIDLRELAKSRRDKRIAQFQFTEPQNAEQETLIHNNL